jgi:hypothetical protein
MSFAVRPFYGLLEIVLVFVATEAWSEIDREPLRAGSNFDVGQMNADFSDKGHNETQMVQRTIVNVVQAVTVEERLRLSVGIRGMFWYSFPETDLAHTRLTKFVSGVLEAQGKLKLGQTEDPWGGFQFGLFPFKYNPDAKNLGEYLFRSGAYPTYVSTGGWSVINSAEYIAEGFDFSFRTGPVNHDVLATIERGIEPINDFSPAYLASLGANGAFTCGVGVEFAHLIAAKPSVTTPTGPTFVGDPLNRYRGDSLVFDTATTGYSNYTFKSTKLVGRAAFNLQSLTHWPHLGSEELKIYSEVALLGIKNYPYYYENAVNRIPIMVGINLPTFKLLDILSLEIEHRKTQFTENVAVSYERGLPVPQIRVNAIDPYQKTATEYDKNSTHKENLKWSIYTRKTLTPGMTLYAQVASDHMRAISYDKTIQSDLITKEPSDWYMLFRIDLGI